VVGNLGVAVLFEHILLRIMLLQNRVCGDIFLEAPLAGQLGSPVQNFPSNPELSMYLLMYIRFIIIRCAVLPREAGIPRKRESPGSENNYFVATKISAPTPHPILSSIQQEKL
jgi:hypothetical protein